MAIQEVEKDGVKVLEYRFQPRLDDGTAIGGEQVVYGATHDELMDKAADNYNNLYRKNRELLRQEKLAGKAPEGSVQAAPQVKFNPRSMTAEERMRVTRDLFDPEKVQSALDLALEARFGAKPEDFSRSVNTNAAQATILHHEQQAAAWKDMHPEFYPTQKNVRDLWDWIQNRNMEFSVETLNAAYEDLAPALETAPPSATGTDSNASQATTNGRITEQVGGVAQRQTATLPTTVSRKTGTTRGAATKKEGITAEQYYRMDNNQRRKYLRENPNVSF